MTETELVEEVNNLAESVSDTLTELEQFRGSITEYRERVENMDETEQDAFYQSASRVREKAAEAKNPEELLALEDDIEEAVLSPLQQVAEESLRELLELIQPDLSENARTQTFEKLENKIPLELDQTATTYQRLYQTVDDLPPVLQEAIARFIEEEPSVLQTPAQDLEPTINDLETRYERLNQLEDTFETADDWAPSFKFVEKERFYQERSASIDISSIKDTLDSIERTAGTLADGDIQVNEVLEDALETWYETGELSGLLGELRDIQYELSEVEDRYQEVAESMAEIEEYDSSTGVFQAELDDLQTEYTQLGLYDYDSIDDLRASLEEIKGKIDKFIGQLHKRLKAQKELINELNTTKEESPPKIHLGPEGSPLLPMHVRDNPTQALKDCNALHEWITTHLEADSESVDQEQMIAIWQSLSAGSEVQLNDENRETILALADRLSLSVVLSGK